MSDGKTYSLVVEPREQLKKASRKLNRQGLVPGVVYGHNVEAQTVQVPRREFDRVYLRAGSNSLVDLSVGEGAEARKVFIHDVQRNPQTHTIRHVDFLVVNLREEITSTVPLVHVGESPIVANNEGVLLSQLDHVLVRALPMDLPSLIEVDMTALDEIGKSIHVSDLTIPANVTLLTSPEEMVARVVEMQLEVEEVEETPEEAEEGARETEAGGAEEGASAGDSEDES
ncbi:MAG: large subunit ribosomal protein [Chloroflexia bacterium]|jgi:large subunit ribosomal protein L25|nr:large subunit ribosomal protein [Chloroflexia bacterium]